MKTEQYRHQRTEHDLHRSDPARALLWQMRTGKSKAVVDKACHLWSCMEIDAMLVVAPNGVHVNWLERELPRHMDVPYVCAAWRSGDPREEERCGGLLTMAWPVELTHLVVLTVNMESLLLERCRKLITRFLTRFSTFLVFDESHHFASPGAKRTAVARGMARMSAYREILTGTPVENSPLQAFSQYELLDRAALGFDNYGDFKKRYAVTNIGRMYVKANKEGGGSRQRMIEQVVGYQNTDELRERMARYSSVVLRSDCEDLPPVQFDQRTVLLGEDQAEWYKKTKKKDVFFLEGLNIFDPLTGAAMLTKLQQIEGGYFIHPGDERERMVQCIALPEHNSKMLALLDEIEHYDGQTIVWCMFLHELHAVEDELAQNGITFTSIYGAVKDRQRLLEQFRRREHQVLVAQPKAASEGLDMSTAGKIVWYSQTPDAIVRSQANERATAIGKGSVQIVDLVVPRGVDAYYLDLTENKITLAEDVSRSGMVSIMDQINPIGR